MSSTGAPTTPAIPPPRRQSMMREGGNVELYPAWDEARDQLIYWSGDWQNTAGVGGPKAFQ